MPSSFWWLPLLLWAGAVTADQPVTADFPRIEVFTLSGQPIAGNTAAISPQVDLQQYELDRIRLIETRLSRDLSADRKQAEAIVLDRFQHLDRATSDSLRQSAVGLAKAMQYGIDRTPAIVFDGQAVVYGVTDISVALAHYQAWQSGKRP
jgi:integrating conjugative element protein (TIGR03757 family)